MTSFKGRKGDYVVAQINNRITILAWHDKREVLMLFVLHDDSVNENEKTGYFEL